MSGSGDGPAGPDLGKGIPAEELLDGSLLAGHVGDDAVLLARVDGEVLAVSASCTHYGGPLADGVLDGDTVRCPWHHACFSLRTGEPLRPPALADLDRWNVVEADGRIRVTGKAPSARPQRTPSHAPDSVVILGAGAAGNAAAETLRREGYEGPITMIDADDGAPCDRPNLSKDYLAGNAPEEWIPLHPPEFYADRRIEIVRTEVTAIHPHEHAVEFADGGRRSYGALILAPGAEPVRLPVPVADGARLLYLRTLADSRAIIAAADGARRAVVIGASFIGLEVAASLRNRGVEVHIVAPESVPLAPIMGPELGAYVRQLHESNGVVFHLGRTVAAVNADHATLDNGTRLDADFVVAGIGVRPRLALAQNAGLEIDNGIVCDEFLETSAPGVWAAGDAARWPDPRTGNAIRVEHWVLAERMGQAAARNVLGANQRFDAVPFFWSQHYDATIAYVGHAPDWDRATLEGNPEDMDCAVTFSRNGKRLAVATIFRDEVSLRAEMEMEGRTA